MNHEEATKITKSFLYERNVDTKDTKISAIRTTYVVSAFRRTRSDRRPSVTPRITVRLKPDTTDVFVVMFKCHPSEPI